MRVLFIGDIVGESGRRVVTQNLLRIRDKYKLDFVIANGENSASGFGITEKILHSLIDSGVDVITSGNHIWDQKDTLIYIERETRLLRPANYPKGTPGKGSFLYKAKNGEQILVINIMGRVFMNPLDDPFRIIDDIIDNNGLNNVVDAIFVDFHAEATSEKNALALHFDGKVSVIAGTHTHIPTSDTRILPNGTAYQTDLGMCGDYQSVIGMEKTEPIRRFITGMTKERFRPAEGEATLSGIVVDINNDGLANKISPFRYKGLLSQSGME